MNELLDSMGGWVGGWVDGTYQLAGVGVHGSHRDLLAELNHDSTFIIADRHLVGVAGGGQAVWRGWVGGWFSSLSPSQSINQSNHPPTHPPIFSTYLPPHAFHPIVQSGFSPVGGGVPNTDSAVLFDWEEVGGWVGG